MTCCMFYEINQSIKKQKSASELIDVGNALLCDGVQISDLISVLASKIHTGASDAYTNEIITAHQHFVTVQSQQ